MKIALIVHENSTVTFDSEVKLAGYKLDPSGRVISSVSEKGKRISLTPGVYGAMLAIDQAYSTAISVESGCDFVIAGDKTPWPDPLFVQKFSARFPSTQSVELNNLFPAAVKGVDLSAATNQPEARGHGDTERNGTGTTGR